MASVRHDLTDAVGYDPAPAVRQDAIGSAGDDATRAAGDDPVPAVRFAGPGPLFVATTPPAAEPAASGGGGCTVRAVEDAALLHGWHAARTAIQLLALVTAPTTLPPASAVQHAARSLEAHAPGSAALCGLARALHTTRSRRGLLVREVTAAAGARLREADRWGLTPVAILALHAVLALAAAAPDDPAVLAPLFLRFCRLPAGAEVRLLDAVPVVVLTGAVELSLGGARLDVGGLSGSGLSGSAPSDADGLPASDVVRFTDALRPTPGDRSVVTAPSQAGSTIA